MVLQKNIALLVEKDALFAAILEKYGMPGFPLREEGFESMCKTILEQQVSLDSARASFNRLKIFLGSFTPGAVLSATDDAIRSCGITRQKTAYIKVLAQAVQDGSIDFNSFRNKDTEHVRAELITVKGIGNWTIDIYMMFSLQSPDILPLGDIGIVSAIKDLTGLQAINEILEYTKSWSPYRTTAAFLLWHYYLEKRGRKFPH